MRALLASSASFLVVLLLLSATPAARGDDSPSDESAAAKAFRDAWWAETGGGNLNQALDLYAKAIDAEGPASVKARALYRRAVVLQRIGKTEDAIRALERLAKDFPGEAQPNADARARLAEWTAVDLRSSFSEWFKRYQYSPEFQAKVVDLVLKLGGNDNAAAFAAEAELLTIGEASVPALEEHAASKNTGLAARAQKLLLMLGRVPDGVVDVTSPLPMWSWDARPWAAILSLPEARRAALRDRVTGASWGQRALVAALAGPEAALAWLATPGQEEERQARVGLLAGLATVLPKDAPLLEKAADLAVAEGQPESTRRALAQWTMSAGRVTAERVKAWASHSSPELRQMAWSQIEGGHPLEPAEAWPLVIGAIEAYAGKRWRDEQGLEAAFRRTLEAAPWPESLDRAAGALLMTGGSLGRGKGSERYGEALARAFELAADENAASNALSEWRQGVGSSPKAVERVTAWRQRVEPAWRRRVASRVALNLAVDQSPAALLDLLTDASMSVEDLQALWSTFFYNYGERPLRLREDPRAVRRLLDRVMAVGDMPNVRQGLTNYLMGVPAGTTLPADAFVTAILEAPDRTPESVLHSGTLVTAVNTGDLEKWRAAWRQAWPTWTLPQRAAALYMGTSLLQMRGNGPSVAFVRERLRAKPPEIDARGRYAALSLLGDLTLADLQAVYDLTKPEDVDVAAQWARPWGVGEPPRLALTDEVYRALRLAMRPDGDPANAASFAAWLDRTSEAATDLVDALLAHKDLALHRMATDILLARSSPADESLWVKALHDPDVETRTAAAKGMERVPTPVVKRALVGALDDPHPDVRSAALSSLDALQKMEDLKARWREKVK